MVHYSKCPLCGSKETGLYIQTNDFFLTGEPFSLFRCNSCGFIFTQDHPDEINTGRYYSSEEYLSHNDTAKGISGKLYRFTRSIMLRRKRRMVEKTTGMRKGAILDIGSGSGHFLCEMKRSGWEVKGIEINEKARQYSISEHNVEVIDPGLISFLPAESFNCITLWHVFEHFHDPDSYAHEILRLLKPGGVCIAALPNSNSYDSGYYRKFWAAWDVPRHLWHFTPSVFGFFAHRSGFRIKIIRSLPMDVFYISMLSEKYKKSFLYFVAGIIKGFYFFTLSVFRKKKSSSLVYFLQKIQEHS